MIKYIIYIRNKLQQYTTFKIPQIKFFYNGLKTAISRYNTCKINDNAFFSRDLIHVKRIVDK